MRPAGPDPDPRVGPAAGRRRLPLSLSAIAIPALFGVVRIVVSFRRPFLAGGDAAFIELAIRQALRGRQLLGPYSRFGWRHPGPILFYLFAPLYWLSGQRSRSMFLSAWLVNIGCAIAVVVLVRRRLGEGAARVTAAGLVVFCIATGFEPLINPWNPSLLALPFILLVFLAGDAAIGSGGSLLGTLVVGSYLIQTHLGMLPVVGVTVGLAAAGWIVAARRSHGGRVVDQRRVDRRRVDRRLAVIALVGLGFLWSGPVIDQLTRDPGNARAIAGFFRSPPTELRHGHPLDDALTAVANGATGPFLGEVPSGDRPRGRVLALVGAGLLGLIVAAAGRKRAPFAARLGALGGVNVVIAVLATTRVVGDLEPYLFSWTPALLLPPLIAAALLAFDDARRLAGRLGRGRAGAGRHVAALGAAAMIVAGALLVDTTVQHATISYTDSPDAVPAARLIEAHAGHDRRRVFRIHVIDGQFQMSSLLLRLERDGYRFRMSPSYGLYTGSTGRRPDDGAPIIVVGTTASPTRPASTPLGTVGPFVLSTVTTLD